MTGYLPADLLIGLAAVCTALGVLWAATLPIRRQLRRLDQMLDDWHGHPARPGFDAVPGVPDRLKSLEQLERNGGGSVADKVHDTAEAVTALTGDVEHLSERTEANASGIAALHVRVNGMDERVTDHRRRNDATAERLEHAIEERLDRLMVERDSYRSALHELGFEPGTEE